MSNFARKGLVAIALGAGLVGSAFAQQAPAGSNDSIANNTTATSTTLTPAAPATPMLTGTIQGNATQGPGSNAASGPSDLKPMAK